jgi:hypothetical protein
MEPVATNGELLERAYGVLAERFGVEIQTAAAVLAGTARCERRDLHELARAVVSSCCESVVLPRQLYDCGGDFMSAA